MYKELIEKTFSKSIAKEIQNKYQHRYIDFFRASKHELLMIKGIGEKQANTIYNLIALYNYTIFDNLKLNDTITTSELAIEYIRSLMSQNDYSRETVIVLFVNRRNKLIHKRIVTQGGLASSIIPVNVILKKAIEFNASGIILAHNHPSGNMKPSEADKNITEKLSKGAKILELNLLDSIIFHETDYLSFTDSGML